VSAALGLWDVGMNEAMYFMTQNEDALYEAATLSPRVARKIIRNIHFNLMFAQRETQDGIR